MLDAYIIDRIKRERDQQERGDDAFVPLHIDVPRPPGPEDDDRDEEDDRPERGTVIIDFHV